MKTILALMLAGAFLTSPIVARAGDDAPAAHTKTAKKSKKSKTSKKDGAAAEKKAEEPKAEAPAPAPAPEKKAEKGGW